MTSPSDQARSLHPLLRRQIKRAGLAAQAIDEVPGLAALVASISRAYDDADQLRYLNDRAFALSESEQQALSALLDARMADAARDRARMMAVFEATPTPFLVLARDGIVLDANAAAISVLARDDYVPTQLVGRKLSAAISVDPDDVASRMKVSSLLAAVNERAPWADSLRIIRGGTIGSTALAFRPFDPSQEAAGILSIDPELSQPG